MRILSRAAALSLTLLLTLELCANFSSALFLPLIKALKAHTTAGGGGYGGNYYASNYGYSGYGAGHRRGYRSAYGSPYNSAYGSPYNSGYGSTYGNGYAAAGYRRGSTGGGGGGNRRGRTYTDIARVINPDVYVGGRFSPRQPFYNLG